MRKMEGVHRYEPSIHKEKAKKRKWPVTCMIG